MTTQGASTDLVQRLRAHATYGDSSTHIHSEAADELARLRAECEALRKDAERYRFTRKLAFQGDNTPDAEIDAQIDALMAARKGSE